MWTDVRGGGVCKNFKTIYNRLQGRTQKGWTPTPIPIFRKFCLKNDKNNTF